MFWKSAATSGSQLFCHGRRLKVSSQNNLPLMLPLACSLRGFSAKPLLAPSTPDSPDDDIPLTTHTTPPNHNHQSLADNPFSFLRDTPNYPGYLVQDSYRPSCRCRQVPLQNHWWHFHPLLRGQGVVEETIWHQPSRQPLPRPGYPEPPVEGYAA